ncbi:MAG: cupin domain-containing protein [Methanomicrobiales archaeon]|nr:cupin domain-containing protein [Methanomicrobiales archaeon]
MADKNRQELLGKKFLLKDLIQYQEGSIASRMIITQKSGSITLFSFDLDEGLSDHTAPFDAVVTVLEGECEVTVDGVPSRLTQGETIIFPAHIPHAVKAISRFKMVLTMIRESSED